MPRLLPATALAVLLSASLPALAETTEFHADLKPGSEVPPKDTKGSGLVVANLDTATKKLDYTVTFAGLTGPATMAHFHGPAAPGVNAGVQVPLGNDPKSPIHGSATLTDSQIADLEAGKWYANVHTAANPAGEIRGQLTQGK